MYLVDAISRPGSIPLVDQQPNQITDYATRFGRNLNQIVGWCEICDEKDKDRIRKLLKLWYQSGTFDPRGIESAADQHGFGFDAGSSPGTPLDEPPVQKRNAPEESAKAAPAPLDALKLLSNILPSSSSTTNSAAMSTSATSAAPALVQVDVMQLLKNLQATLGSSTAPPSSSKPMEQPNLGVQAGPMQVPGYGPQPALAQQQSLGGNPMAGMPYGAPSAMPLSHHVPLQGHPQQPPMYTQQPNAMQPSQLSSMGSVHMPGPPMQGPPPFQGQSMQGMQSGVQMQGFNGNTMQGPGAMHGQPPMQMTMGGPMMPAPPMPMQPMQGMPPPNMDPRMRPREPNWRPDGPQMGGPPFPNGAPMHGGMPPVESDVPRDHVKVLSRTLFLANVPDSATEPSFDVLSKFSPIDSISFLRKKYSAFVRMRTRRGAELAYEYIQNNDISGSRMKVGWGCGYGPTEYFQYHSGVSIIPIKDLIEEERPKVPPGGTIEEPEMADATAAKRTKRRAAGSPPYGGGRGRGFHPYQQGGDFRRGQSNWEGGSDRYSRNEEYPGQQGHFGMPPSGDGYNNGFGMHHGMGPPSNGYGRGHGPIRGRGRPSGDYEEPNYHGDKRRRF